MKLELIRTYAEGGTNGKFTIEELYICSSIELPNKANKRKISCIPEGVYPIQVVQHSKFKECIKLDNVPQRRGIYIHAMNDANRQSKGCIGAVQITSGIAKGLYSKDALKALIKLIKEKKIQQIIIKSKEYEHNSQGTSPNPKILQNT